MSKKRLEEIIQMVNTFDDSSFFATLYGYEMDSKALISDFVYLLKCIDDQQATIDSLSMAHDAIHRELPKDKHTLIKNIIGLNKRVRELEERVRIFEMKYENTGSIMNRSHQIDRIKKLEQQNKRYRQTMFFLELKLLDFKEYANKIGKLSDEKMIKDYAGRFMGDISETLQALEGEE